MSADKFLRKTLPEITELDTSTARVRKCIDVFGLNHTVQSKIDACNEELLSVKKQGGPSKPVEPTGKSTEERLAYEKAFSEWKKYSSVEYEQLLLKFNLYKLLEKLAHELDVSADGKNKALVETYQTCLSDKPAARKESESGEAYKRRLESFVEPGYKALLFGTDLNSAESLRSKASQLVELNPTFKVLKDKEELSRQKIRFNDEGVVAMTTVAESVITECARHAMKSATDDNKKTVKPDHLLGLGYDKLSLYPTFKTLPHFVTLLSKHERQAKHEEALNSKKKELTFAARNKCKSAGKPYRRDSKPDFSALKTFEDSEVEHGFAVKKQGEKKPNRVSYHWKYIDFDDSDYNNANTFSFYVDRVFKNMKGNECLETLHGKCVDNPKISKSVKTFLSNLMADFLHRLSPKLRLLSELSDVKTVNADTVLASVKLILSDCYHERDGHIHWSDEHNTLFNNVKRNVELVKAYNESQKNAKAESHLEPEPTPVPEPTPAPILAPTPTPTPAPAEPVLDNVLVSNDELPTESVGGLLLSAAKAVFEEAKPKLEEHVKDAVLHHLKPHKEEAKKTETSTAHRRKRAA